MTMPAIASRRLAEIEQERSDVRKQAEHDAALDEHRRVADQGIRIGEDGAIALLERREIQRRGGFARRVAKAETDRQRCNDNDRAEHAQHAAPADEITDQA